MPNPKPAQARTVAHGVSCEQCRTEAEAKPSGGLLSRPGAAEYLSVSVRTVDELIRSGALAAVRVGVKNGTIRITRVELDRYVSQLPAYEPATPVAVS